MKSFIYVAIILSFSISLAQNNYEYVWAKSGGGIDFFANNSEGERFYNSETVREIVVDSQDNFYFLCNMTTGNRQFDGNPILSITNQGRKDVVLISTDCDGNFRWSKSFGSHSDALVEYITIDANDNLYITVRLDVKFNSNDIDTQIDTDLIINSPLTQSDIGPHARTLYMVSYDNTGALRWIHQPHNPQADFSIIQSDIYGGIHIDNNDVIHSLVRLNEGVHENGNITVPVQPNPILGQWFIIKYDDLGNYLSHQAIPLGGTFFQDRVLFEYDEINDQYYIALSEYTSTNRNFSYNGILANGLAMLIAIDNVGNELWRHGQTNLNSPAPLYIGALNINQNNDLQVMLKGGAFGAQETFAGYTFPSTNMINGDSFLTVVTLNPFGNLVWGVNASSGILSDRTGLNDSNVTAVSSAIGNSGSPTTFAGLTYNGLTNAQSDPVHFTLDTATGAGLSINSIEGNFGFNDGTIAVAFDSHGNMIVGGFMRESLFLNHPTVPIITRSGGFSELWVAKLAKTDCNGVPLSINDTTANTNIKIAQNPVKEWLQLIAIPDTTTSYKIYSLSGRILQSGTLKHQDPNINIASYKTGTYFIQITTSDGHETLQFVKE